MLKLADLCKCTRRPNGIMHGPFQLGPCVRGCWVCVRPIQCATLAPPWHPLHWHRKRKKHHARNIKKKYRRNQSRNRCQVDNKSITNQAYVLEACWVVPRGGGRMIIRRTDLDPFWESFSIKRWKRMAPRWHPRNDSSKGSKKNKLFEKCPKINLSFADVLRA